MRWQDGRRSENVDDRRDDAGGGGGGGGLGPIGGRGLIAMLVAGGIAVLLGFDPIQVLSFMQSVSQQGSTQPAPRRRDPDVAPGGPKRPDPRVDFVSVVLADTEDVWKKLLPPLGRAYEEPRLVLFRDRVSSACGRADASVGPFYCPGDHQVYLDLSFFDELKSRFGAPGDFAQAYVIGHEVGHHVQVLLGTSDRVHRAGARRSRGERNALSVRQELQADCYAGVWAHHADKDRHILEEGDVEEGLNAAAAIGDDRLQRRSGREVVPESFTHGSSEQRVRWFRQGLTTGDPRACDTFAAATP